MAARKNAIDTNLPTIVCMADCKHYLIENFNRNAKWTTLYKTANKKMFNSLHEAKQYLRTNNVIAVNLSFQSAYDEMCGSEVNADYAITMKL